MKKVLVTLVILLVLALAAIYYLVPGTLTVAETVKLNCNSEAAFRTIGLDTLWQKWANGDSAAGIWSEITAKKMNGFDILIHYKDEKIASQLNIIPVKRDSAIVSWQYSRQSGSNPLLRVAAYNKAVAIKKNMALVTGRMQNYLSVFENIYGFTLKESSTTDTLFISTKAISPNYPGTDFIYLLINKLKAFCTTQGCSVTGYPMLNITKIDAGQYRVMTALPVNRMMLGKGEVNTGKMVKGKFIVTDVTGGVHTVDETLAQIHNYFHDYGRMSMAIPFSYLITDRQQEKDTSKWVTRIYAPVY